MSDLVGNPEDRFSRVAAHIILVRSFKHCQQFENFSTFSLDLQRLPTGILKSEAISPTILNSTM